MDSDERIMSEPIDPALLEAYSRAELTRRDIEDRTGKVVTFGRLLLQLHAHDLPLPRFPVDTGSPGVRLVWELAEKAARRGK